MKAPPSTIDPSPGFHREWLNAYRGGALASCNFDYVGPLTEAVPLANIAYPIHGEFAWDGAAMKSSRDHLKDLLERPYREGWRIV